VTMSASGLSAAGGRETGPMTLKVAATNAADDAADAVQSPMCKEGGGGLRFSGRCLGCGLTIASSGGCETPELSCCAYRVTVEAEISSVAAIAGSSFDATSVWSAGECGSHYSGSSLCLTVFWSWLWVGNRGC